MNTLLVLFALSWANTSFRDGTHGRNIKALTTDLEKRPMVNNVNSTFLKMRTWLPGGSALSWLLPSHGYARTLCLEPCN